MDYYTRRQEIATEVWAVCEKNRKATAENIEKLISHIVAKFGCSEKFARSIVEANVKSGHLEVSK